MKRSGSGLLKICILFLVASLLDGCGTTQLFIKDSSDPERATIYFHRMPKIVSGGGELYVFEDSDDIPSNGIIGFGKGYYAGFVYPDFIIWAYLDTSGQSGNAVFGKSRDPEGSYAKHDAYLSKSRSKQVSDDLLIRRTTIIGSVRRGDTVKWLRPAGTFRMSAAPTGAAETGTLYMSDWMKVAAGKSYRIVFDLDNKVEGVFKIEELK